MPKCLIYILFVFGSLNGSTQELFSGRLTYSIEYLNIPADMKGVEKQLPSKISIVTDGSNWRSVQYTEINGDYIQVYDSKADSIFEMITIGPERVRVSNRTLKKVSLSNTKDKGESQFQMETKIVDVKLESGENQSMIFLADYMPIPSLFYHGLVGVPTSLEVGNAGVIMRLSLSKIHEEPIDKTYFTLPDDYKWVDNSLYQSWLR